MLRSPGDPPLAGLIAGFDVLTGDQREQPDQLRQLLVQRVEVDRSQDRPGVANQGGEQRVAGGRVVPGTGLPALV